ncbi:MAG: GAF domain-containing protein [Thermovirgaceae bacterium]|nr:GAF domain-containing protein [Thermovirgaceae bacterium]
MKRGKSFVVNVPPELDTTAVEALVHKLNVLIRASMIYSLRLDFNSALKVIVELARELVAFEKAVFYLLDEDDKSFYPGLIHGFADKLPPAMHKGNIFLEWTVENSLPVRVEEPDSPEMERLLKEIGCRSLISIPIMVGSDLQGIVQLFSSKPYNFPDETVRLLWILVLQLEGIFHKLTKPVHHTVEERDPFTVLPMRARFEMELEKEFARCRRNNRAFSIFFIEIDNGGVRDQLLSLGMGLILREVAEHILPMVRKIDTFSRFSDTTLALLLPETDLHEATLLANRLRHRLSSVPISTRGAEPELKFTVSVGVSAFPQCMTISELISEAQNNLKNAQTHGGNRVVSPFSASHHPDLKPVSLDLQELLDSLGSFFDMENLLSNLVEFFSRMSGADRVSIMIADESGEKLVFKHGVGFQGFEAEVQKSVLAIEDSICGQALSKRQPLMVDNVDLFMPKRARKGLRYSSPSFLSIPLIFDNDAFGVVNFSNRRDRGTFTQMDLQNLLPHVTAMSKLLAEGKRFVGIQKEFLHETADILLNIAESKSPYLRGHAERVSEASYRVSRKLKMNEADAMRIAKAARFHDLGRIAIDESILGRKGPLNSGESSLVRQHPLWSARILENFPKLDLDIQAVKTHHERYDGHGYPDGLMGEEIPIGGRILAVADAFDAMTHERPFRSAMSVESALDTLMEKSGTQFDKRIVKAFKETIQ